MVKRFVLCDLISGDDSAHRVNMLVPVCKNRHRLIYSIIFQYSLIRPRIICLKS